MQQNTFRRLLAAVMALALVQLVFSPAVRSQLLSILVFAETGRVVSTAAPETQPHNSIFPTQTTQQSEPEIETDAVISFSSEDLEGIQIQYNCDYTPDTEALLTKPLAWDLTSDAPTVLIIHTHGSESYTGSYEATEVFHTLDDTQNMIAIGDEVARVLEAGGITVLHDRNIYDYPDYNGAYSAARTSIRAYLEEYPTIRLVLDLHRDAATVLGQPFVTTATAGGQSCAQLMMVVGTDAGGRYHPNWQENLSLALKLTALLEQQDPGICRSIDLRSQRFNMDLSTGSLLVEVGATGNTLDEAIIAANALAQAVLTLAQGSQ